MTDGRDTGEGRRLARNALSSYAERSLLMLSAFLLTPYLFRRLGVEGFGTWSVMFTVTTVFTMLEIGFSAGTTKFVAELKARRDRDGLDSTVGMAVVMMAGLGVVALGVSVAIALLAPGLAAESERDAFRVGMLVIGLAMLVRLPCLAYGAALAGYQRFDRFNAGQALVTLLFAIGTVLAVELGAGVLGVAVAWGAALVAGGLAFALLMRRTDPRLSLRPRTGQRDARRRILSFSSFALLANSMVFVGQRMDTIIVAALRDAAAAAPIAAAAKLQSGLQAATLPVLNMLMPMASDLHARGRSAEVARRYALATRVTLQITLPMAAAVAVFSADIVQLWLGSEAPQITDEIVAILALQTIFLTAVPAEKVLVGIGRVRTVGALNMAEGLANLCLSIALVRAYGASGAAIATLTTSALLGPLKLPIACRAMGRSTLRFIRRSVLPALVSSAPALAAMALVRLAFDAGLVRLGVGTALALGLAGAIALVQLGGRRGLADIRRLARAPGPTAPDSLAEPHGAE